jgi:hypothetical protein
LQEEVNQKTVALSVNTAKMTANVLKSMMRAYLASQRQKHQQHAQKSGMEAVKRGKTSLRELQKGGAQLSTIEVTDGNIKSFERTARKYGITFSLKKDKTQDPPRYIVFFRGKDVDVIQQAFKEFSAAEIVKANKPSIRQRLAKSLQKSQAQQHQHRQSQSQKALHGFVHVRSPFPQDVSDKDGRRLPAPTFWHLNYNISP